MTAKECVQRMDDLNMMINAKTRQAASLRDSLSIGAPPPDAERVSHTRNVHVMADKLAAVVDVERETDALVDELVDLKSWMIDAINQLPDPKGVTLLTERYIDGKSTDAIAEEKHYSRRRIQQLLREGTEQLDMILATKDFAGFRHISPVFALTPKFDIV